MPVRDYPAFRVCHFEVEPARAVNFCRRKVFETKMASSFTDRCNEPDVRALARQALITLNVSLILSISQSA